jgi:hypothetical protein
MHCSGDEHATPEEALADLPLLKQKRKDIFRNPSAHAIALQKLATRGKRKSVCDTRQEDAAVGSHQPHGPASGARLRLFHDHAPVLQRKVPACCSFIAITATLGAAVQCTTALSGRAAGRGGANAKKQHASICK